MSKTFFRIRQFHHMYLCQTLAYTEHHAGQNIKECDKVQKKVQNVR